MAVNAIIIVGYGLGQCHPVSKQWEEELPGHCNKPATYNHVIVATSAVNAFGDFALALFPTLILKDLQMQMQRKIVVISLMSFGIVLFSSGDEGLTPLKKIASTKQDPSSQELGSAKEGSEQAHGSLESPNKHNYTVEIHEQA
ncbi:MAG: hypothetical protein Q9191_003203 [Dirinaria sp. TL-2023a]